MTGLEALQAVQFVTVRGRRLSVLNVEDWEAMVEWLETLEDVSLAKDAHVRFTPRGTIMTRQVGCVGTT